MYVYNNILHSAYFMTNLNVALLNSSFIESVSGFCTTQDVDIFLRHMNNARYVRELDFARFHFYDRTGIYTNIKAVDGHALQGASSIRYRRTIPIFSAYKVETKVSIQPAMPKSIFL